MAKFFLEDFFECEPELGRGGQASLNLGGSYELPTQNELQFTSRAN